MCRKLLFLGMFLFLSLCLANAATVDPVEALLFMEIPQVSSAGFFTQDAKDAPGYSQVFKMEDIAKSPVRTLADLVENSVIGSQFGWHSGNGALIGTRGVLIDNSAKTLVMFDGEQMNQRMHFGYMRQINSPFLGDVDRIEVIQGPGAIVHGSGAINGFINLIHKNGNDSPGLTANLEYGIQDEFKKGEIGYGKTFGEDANIYLYAAACGAPGFGVVRSDGLGRKQNAWAYRDQNFKVSSYLKSNNFKLNFSFERLNVGENYTESLAGETLGSGHVTTMGLSPRYKFELDKSSLEVIGAWELFDNFNNSSASRAGGAEAHREIKIIYRNEMVDKHQFALGALYGNRDFRENKYYFSADYDSNSSNQAITTGLKEYGIFAEDIITLTDKLTASIGGRYDNAEFSTVTSLVSPGQSINPAKPGGHFSPRLAAAYDIDDTLTVKASYQQGFRYPDAYYYITTFIWNRILSDGGLGSMAPLKPETMDSYEINLSKKFTESFACDLNLFKNYFKNQLTWGWFDATDPGVVYLRAHPDLVPSNMSWMVDWPGGFVNVADKSTAKGAELIGRASISKNISLKLGYAYAVTSNNLKYHYDNYQVKTDLVGKFMDDRLTVDLMYVYYPGYNLAKHDLPSGSLYKKDSNTVDVAFNYDFTKNVSAKLTVKNLFANDVPPMVYSPGARTLGYDVTRVYLGVNTKW